jgi:DNA polymerase theta
MDEDKLRSMTEAALQELLSTGLLCLKDDASYEPTQLGQAIVASSLSPEDGVFVHDELKRTLQAFVMDGEMHVFYLFTPLQMGATKINWTTLRDEINSLNESGIRVLQFVRVKPSFVNAMYANIVLFAVLILQLSMFFTSTSHHPKITAHRTN